MRIVAVPVLLLVASCSYDYSTLQGGLGGGGLGGTAIGNTGGASVGGAAVAGAGGRVGTGGAGASGVGNQGGGGMAGRGAGGAGGLQTTCTDDTACSLGSFCSGNTCVGVPNLAGNGDLESGTVTGWSTVNGSGSPTISSPGSSGYAHIGRDSIVQTGRSANYLGPGYYIPGGLGKYTISAWGMQVQDGAPLPTGVLQIGLRCASGVYSVPVQNTGVGISLPEGVWTQYSATVDTSTNSATGTDCFPNAATPGLVQFAFVYLSEPTTDTNAPVVWPDLYMDDLVVEVTDGHNLVGNPNFEAGFVAGWTLNGSGSSSLEVSATVAHGGTHSLWEQTRSLPTTGIKYELPIGVARYLVSFQVLQSGTMDHVLALQAAYSCIGSSTLYTPTNTMVTVKTTANTWMPLGGTFVFPPLDAPAGCELSSAAVDVQQAESGSCASIECPDLYLDDASITLK